MHLLRLLLVPALVTWFAFPIRADEAEEADLKLLQAQGIATDNAGLLGYLRLRMPHETDAKVLGGFVRQLGGNYKERQEAVRVLVMRGPVAIPYVKAGMKGASLEVIRRAEQVIGKIESVGPEYPAAAARILARRQTPEAIPILLQYLTRVEDDWQRDEVLGCLGRLLVRQGKVDPLLMAELKSAAPQRRAIAAYILARNGDREQRDTVRHLLGDPDAEVRLRAAQGLLTKRLWLDRRDNAAADDALLKSQLGGSDESLVLAFLRKRTFGEQDQERVRALIRRLGAATFQVRDEASRKLIAEGPPALNHLRIAARDPDLEIARRAFICLEKIKRGPGPELPTAAIRSLLDHPAGQSVTPAIQTLLAFVPFADDSMVEEEALNALCLLSVRQEKIEPILPAALHDSVPARRAAAAYVLGRVGATEHCLAVRSLFADADATVRFRAAQGLIHVRDRDAIPVLLALLGNANSGLGARAEEILGDLAGGKEVAATEPAAREKAWRKWWRDHAAEADLTRLGREQYFGLITIAEYDSPAGATGGRVFECARDGKERWQINGVTGAMDGHVLPNGNVLVAENAARRVTERDRKGLVKWEYALQSNPIACQRLANGNTFIATYNQLMEITPARKIAYLHSPGAGFYLFSAHKYANGQIVCMSAQGKVLVIDARTGQEIRSIHVAPQGGWCSAEMLSNGRYLVASMVDSRVREIDSAGKSHFELTFPGAFRATRLPNGHLLVASMTTRKVAEFDRTGKLRWEKTCIGRPWSVRFR